MKSQILFAGLILFLLAIGGFCIFYINFIGSQFVEVSSGYQAINFIKHKTPPKILFVGDMMFDRGVEVQMKKNGDDYLFGKISDFLKVQDLFVGNLEGPIVVKPPSFSDASLRFAFAPETTNLFSFSKSILLSLANNHTFNMGAPGFEQAENFLKEAGINFIGHPEDCKTNFVFQKDNIVYLAFNKTYSYNCSDQEISDIIKNQRQADPDKFLVVILHWGEEYQGKSSKTQQNLGHLLIDSGADLIVGGHPHVVQEIEEYEGKLIFYSLGNFIFDQNFSIPTQQSLALQLQVYPDKSIVKIIPIQINLSQPVVMPESDAGNFLKSLAEKSSSQLASQIENGVIVEKKTSQVCFQKFCFQVDLATTQKQRDQGLMFVKNLPQNQGMLFVFDARGIYPFWMKNTLIPLDMIWLDESQNIVFIKNNALPCMEDLCENFTPPAQAKYVLEINSGLAEQLKLAIGDKADIIY